MQQSRVCWLLHFGSGDLVQGPLRSRPVMATPVGDIQAHSLFKIESAWIAAGRGWGNVVRVAREAVVGGWLR